MTNHSHFFNRPNIRGLLVGLLGGLTLAVAQFFTPAGVGTAQAATTNCTPNGGVLECTVTFDYSGAAESWTVPASVTSVTVDLYGGKGGDGLGAGGGKGAHVQAELPVTSGETLGIVVAGQGGNGQAFGGGGRSSIRPGVRMLNGGGGASHVERNGVRLLVAGGGGGAAGHGGVGGGNSANPGVTYSGFGAGLWDGRGGGAGTVIAGGAGGAGGLGSAFSGCSTLIDGTPGADGSFGQGGNGGGDSGGGGGGGYYGGGGGGMPGECTSQGVIGRPGGGGGGSSYIDASATQIAITEGVQNGNGQVVINYSLLDSSAPLITPQIVGTLGNDGWYVSDVTVSWTVVDNESIISSQSGCEDQNVTSDTTGITFTCSATSVGGSSSESVTIKRDATAPTISAAASSTPNANGWYNSNVTTVQFTCNDNLSGVVSCPADEVLSSESSAVSSTAQTITDQAGNSSAASNVVTVKIDKTAPIVTVTGVSNGASYPLGSVPAAGCSTTDALSGVATQATLSVTGGNPDGTGTFTATCSGATDVAGNSGGASVSYQVNYRWSGFFQPVDNLPTINIATAGTGIPVKFSLGGNFGLSIFATGYPKVQAVACPNSGTGGGSSAIDVTVTAGSSSLQYDPTTQTYTYVWKTNKAWAGTCRLLTVKLIDGSEHSAFFQFKGKARSAAGGVGDEAGDDAGEEAAPSEETLSKAIFLPLISNQ